jgi:hypothetical protein
MKPKCNSQGAGRPAGGLWARPASIPVRALLCLACILAALASLFPLTAAAAQGEAGPSLSIAAGLDGFAKEGGWLPIRVVVENQGEDLEGVLQVHLAGFNNRRLTFSQNISLPQVSRKELFLYVFPETYQGEITVELVAGNQKLAEASDRITSASRADTIYAILAENSSVYNFLSQFKPQNANSFTAFLQPGDVPDHYLGLAALDTLLISGVDTGAFSPAQRQALQGWVARGGRLVVTGGAKWRETAAGLEELLPLLPKDEQNLSDLSALSAFAQEAAALEGEAPAAVGDLAPGAQVQVQQGETPLVVRRPYGSGEVLFLAVDPALEPLAGWAGLPELFRPLLTADLPQPGWGAGFQNWEMAHQAAAALPDFGLPSAWSIFCFLGIYILAVGPLNYLILRRMKRRELAWLSIPVLVILFGGLAFSAGSSALGSRPILNRMAIVQLWPEVDQAQVDGVVGIFSPRRDRFTLETSPGFLAHGVQAGIDLTQAGGVVVQQDEGGGSLVPDLRLDIGGVRTVSVQGEAPAPQVGGDLVLSLGEKWASLQGRVSSPADLRLEDAVLLSPGSPTALGSLQPGETIEVDTMITSEARAREAGSGQSDPYGYRPYVASTSFTDELLGGGDYYRDERLYRRFTLLNALASSGFGPGGQNGGFYLAGWNQESPLGVNLRGENFGPEGTTLYLIGLRPEIRWEEDTAQLPPALFTWTALETPLGIAASPYDSWVDPSGFSLQFQLSQPIPYRAVKELVLHLESPAASGPAQLAVSLWDYRQNRWDRLDEIQWGTHSIASPERYIGPGGEIRLRLAAAGTFGQVQISRADFSLIVER